MFLPRTVGAYLLAQEASKNGAPLFQLSTPHGSVTHAGVLEFTAPEGVILLPTKVARCLFPGGKPSGSVVVKYVRLEKGAFVSFQPLSRGFHDAVDDNVREVLEAALSTHCTLSVGDVVEAQHNGETFILRVSARKWERQIFGVCLVVTQPHKKFLLTYETFTNRPYEALVLTAEITLCLRGTGYLSGHKHAVLSMLGTSNSWKIWAYLAGKLGLQLLT